MLNEDEAWHNTGRGGEELEKIVARHEMQCLELKGSFNVERIDELFFDNRGLGSAGINGGSEDENLPVG